MTTITESIDEFLGYLTNRRKSQNTVETYGTALHKHFRDWLLTVEVPPDVTGTQVITCQMAVDFIDAQSERNISASTLQSRITAISQYLRYLLAKDLVSFELTDWTRLEAEFKYYRKSIVVDRMPRLPNEEEVQEVLDVAQHQQPKPAHTKWQASMYHLMVLRDWAVVQTWRATGCRVGEIVALKRTDLDTERQQATVFGKGRKKRVVRFDEKAWKAVWDYLDARDLVIQPTTNGDPLFTRHDRKASGKLLPLSTNAMRWSLDHLCDKANVDHLTPHQFRHRFATLVLEQTGDITIVQEMLGHSSVQTTQVYAKVSNPRLDKVYHDVKL